MVKYVINSDLADPNPIGKVNIDGLNIKEAEPVAPPSGYSSLFRDGAGGEWKQKNSAGETSVVIPKTEEVTLSTTDDTFIVLKDFTAEVPLNGILIIEGVVKGSRTDGTFGYAVYKYRVGYANDGGTITEIMDAKDWSLETTAAYNIRSRILGGLALVEVRGEVGHSMDWVANFQQT